MEHNVKKKAYMKQWRADNKEKIKAYKKQWLIDNSESEKQYREDNKEKAKAYIKQWGIDNKEKKRAYDKQWCVDNPEKRKAYEKRWYKDNKEKARASRKQWGADNPDILREYNQKRRAKKRSAFVETVDTKMIFEREGGRCRICTRKLSLETKWPNPLFASTDHIVPLSVGGEHSYKNTQLACLECNMKKGNRTVPGGEQLFMFGGIT